MKAARLLVPRETALKRACRAWQCNVVLARQGMRDAGVKGELRNFNEAASGTRGRAAPKGMAMLAYEMAAHGVPLAEREERLTELARLIARVPDAAPMPPSAA